MPTNPTPTDAAIAQLIEELSELEGTLDNHFNRCGADVVARAKSFLAALQQSRAASGATDVPPKNDETIGGPLRPLPGTTFAPPTQPEGDPAVEAAEDIADIDGICIAACPGDRDLTAKAVKADQIADIIPRH